MAVVCSFLIRSSIFIFFLVLLSKILLFGKNLVINGIPMILCFISVIRKVFLKELFKSSFYSIVLV